MVMFRTCAGLSMRRLSHREIVTTPVSTHRENTKGYCTYMGGGEAFMSVRKLAQQEVCRKFQQVTRTKPSMR